ncbi:MAG: DUF2254 domain-containing protein [Desulfobacterales bacterium]|nr:MAG: DUF2254 domain-containing protein [Desulfobacterales bacterium]
MKTRLFNLWYRLRSSFWFLPALMTVLVIGLFFTNQAMDEFLRHSPLTERWWVYTGGPAGARSVLSTIAASMITVAGVVFSITIVVLTLASSQFGPRLIKNFMQVRVYQIVLGTFVATFIYCILVLQTIRDFADMVYVPVISFFFGLLLAILNLGLLIFFIHSVSESIQADNIIAKVFRDLHEATDRIFPDKLGHDDLIRSEQKREADMPPEFHHQAAEVMAENSGYLQVVDNDGLMRIAVEEDLLIHLDHRPGDFITRGHILVKIWPGERAGETLAPKINSVFILGAVRTLEQDVEFAINQMVEVAVRALSPGVNDPFTALTCIDWLGVALSRLAGRRLPSSHRYDDEDRLRVIAKPFDFEGITDAAFNLIRQNALASVAVTIHLLETITTVAARVRGSDARGVLLRHAAMIYRGGKDQAWSEGDREDVAQRYHAAVKALKGSAGESENFAPGPAGRVKI